MKNEKAKGVAVIGELNVDVIATGLTEPPRFGAEILASDFQLALGSASAIFACGMAKLGHPVTFIGQVGADGFGEYCLRALKEAGISTRNVLLNDNLKTGVTISLSTLNDRALVTYLGAISSLKYEQISMSSLEGLGHLHMTSFFLQAGLRPDFKKIFGEVKRMGLTTSFDPNSDPSSEWGNDIWDVFTQTDVLFLNETEAQQLTRAQTTQEALKVLGECVPCAVVKLGPSGAMAIEGGEMNSAPGFRVKPVDTTGAGDSFAAGFISAYLQSRPTVECLRAGNACGALSTLKAGGTAGQPDSETLKTFLDSQREELIQSMKS
jgi:sugar/nucleoside kinase (ribokinase family)